MVPTLLTVGTIKGYYSELISNTNEEIIRANGDTSGLQYDSTRYCWTADVLQKVKRSQLYVYDSSRIILGSYRPFTSQWVYFDPEIVARKYQQDKLFPIVTVNAVAENTATVLAVTRRHQPAPFVVQSLPDLGFDLDGGQCFPLYWYKKIDENQLFSVNEGEKVVRDIWGNRYVRHDAITDRTLEVFNSAYPTAYTTRAKSKGGLGLNNRELFARGRAREVRCGVLHRGRVGSSVGAGQ